MHLLIVLVSLFTVSAINAQSDGILQPTINRAKPAIASNDGEHVIRGLLARQLRCPQGSGACSNTGSCCPIGGDCCNDGNCCPSGEFCIGGGNCCLITQLACEGIGCCDVGDECCSDGGCCPLGWYCIAASNGKIGCCPDGEICSGPAPDPITSTRNGGGGGLTTTEEDSFTTTSTRTRTSVFTSTTSSSTFDTTIPTRTTSSSAFVPQATPSPDPGFTNIFVPPTDAQINWSGGGWSDTSSSCGTSQCRKTTIEGQWFTFIAPLNASGASLYIDVSWEITWFDIFINGQLSDITPSDIDTCSWKQIGPLPTGGQANITIVVVGPLRSGRRQTGSIDDWTFEFNGFLVGQKSTTSDSNTDIGYATTNRPTAALFMIVALFVTIIFSGF